MISADVTVDSSDRLIAAALQVNGRASWGEISRAIDLPERTVARRGQRLLDRGIVRISTYVDVTRVLHARPLLLRIRTAPGALWTVARSLARRADASSVSVLEGSNDIAAMLLPRDEKSIRRLLFEDLPALDDISSINVTTVLKFFRSGYDWRPGILSAEQVAMLDGDRPAAPPPEENGVLSAEEEALVDLLARDGRMPVTELARALSVSVTTARRRLDSLLARGLLHVRTEVVPAVFGLGLEALVWFRAPMRHLEHIGTSLAQAREVKFCAASTGTSQLLANVLVADEDEFYRFLTGPTIAEHDGLEVVESLVVVTPVLRGALVIDNGPMADDVTFRQTERPI